MNLSRRNFLGLGIAAVTSVATPLAWAAQPRCPVGAIVLQPPTRFTVLDGSDKSVFMDTGTGRPESGMFGNTRKYANGAPRFHEGIDIAPFPPWNRKRLPADVVCAAAAGRVMYMNVYHKNKSLYGNYVVLAHEVPGFGQIYTLYGHLRALDKRLRLGMEIAAGTPLGTMGNIPDIPIARSHLHFEIGIIMNDFYPLIDDDHGVWNGANLYGIDPCDAFAEQAQKGYFDIARYIRQRPIAFSYLTNKPMPQYFTKRYPSLKEAVPEGERYIITFSSEGIPTSLHAVPQPEPESPPNRVLFYNAKEVAKGRPFANSKGLTKRGQTLIDNLFVSPTHLPESKKAQGEVG
ncbi:MAG: M23 family metallopeptidase [bacterium]|nr:M23 family metallopeptidase [bacterium]